MQDAASEFLVVVEALRCLAARIYTSFARLPCHPEHYKCLELLVQQEEVVNKLDRLTAVIDARRWNRNRNYIIWAHVPGDIKR